MTWAEREERKAAWKAMSAKLRKAFRALANQGFIARTNYCCCQGCGCSSIQHEAPSRPEAWAYAFYHQQDSESGRECGEVYIAYGAIRDEDRNRQEEAGRVVATAIKAVGLSVEWDGSRGTRILAKRQSAALVRRA